MKHDLWWGMIPVCFPCAAACLRRDHIRAVANKCERRKHAMACDNDLKAAHPQSGANHW